MKDYLDITPPRTLQAAITLPASKSISNRALVINALSHSDIMPENLSDCDDTVVMRQALADMPEVIDIGAAGTAMRFLTAYLAVTPGIHVLTGSERMRHRPIGVLVDALRQLGAEIEYVGEEGFPPLRITGREGLQGGELTLPSDISSQYISALLMIGPTLREGLRLTLTGQTVSRPYLNMTVRVMQDFGAEVAWEGENVIRVAPTPYRPIPYYIENDWSAASYWYEIVALARDPWAEVILPGLRRDSIQGDRLVREIFRYFGVETDFLVDKYGREGIHIHKEREPECYFLCDMTRCPDLAQTVAVTCAALEIPFELSGLQTLRIKETDRIAALKRELEKMCLFVKSTKSSLEWGGSWSRDEYEEPVYEFETYDDHRMAMAFAPVCLRTRPGQPVRILQPSVVTKSYPTFWDDLRKAGFDITTEDTEKSEHTE